MYDPTGQLPVLVPFMRLAVKMAADIVNVFTVATTDEIMPHELHAHFVGIFAGMFDDGSGCPTVILFGIFFEETHVFPQAFPLLPSRVHGDLVNLAQGRLGYYHRVPGRSARVPSTAVGTPMVHRVAPVLPFDTRAGNSLAGSVTIVLVYNHNRKAKRMKMMAETTVPGWMTMDELMDKLDRLHLRLNRAAHMPQSGWVVAVDDMHAVAININTQLLYDPCNVITLGNRLHIYPISLAEWPATGMNMDRVVFYILLPKIF